MFTVKKESIKNIFFKKMLVSALIQFLVLGLVYTVVKNYIAYDQSQKIESVLTINDDETKQKIMQYIILNNSDALNLELHNIADIKDIDSVKYVKNITDFTIFGKCKYLINKNYQICQSESGNFYGITLLSFGEKNIGYIISTKKYDLISSSNYVGLSAILLVVIGGFILNFFILFLNIRNRIEKNTKRLILSTNENALNEHYDINEYQHISDSFLRKEEKIKQLENEKAYNLALQKITERVAHDIKSPIAAINSIIRSMDIDENRKNVIVSAIGRLSEITHHLEIDYSSNEEKENRNNFQASWILPILKTIILEKKYEYEKNRSLNINIESSENSEMSFSYVNSSELKTIISNIINNAIEASDYKGNVTLSLNADGKYTYINVTDQGKGIPSNIIANVTNKGFSYNKPGGKGIGLYHAKSEIEKMQGNLKVESEIGKGTSIKIFLPMCPAPSWICTELYLDENKIIVVLDNDASMYNLWKLKLNSHGINNVIFFSNYTELYDLLKNTVKEDYFFLVDYDLYPCELNGIEIIETLNRPNSSVLVTNRFDSNEIQKKALNLGIKILPKPLIHHLEIKIVSNIKNKTYILIDNDKLVIKTWEFAAMNVDIELKVYNSITDFENDYHKIDKASFIYIDSDLGDGRRGEVYAKKLYDQGFENIYLTTGRSKDKFKGYDWLSGIIDKTPPFQQL